MKLQRWQSNDANLQHKLDQMEIRSKDPFQEEKTGDIFSPFESSLKVLGSVWDRKNMFSPLTLLLWKNSVNPSSTGHVLEQC